MQNLIKESPHLTLPRVLKEHGQYYIQQQASDTAFLIEMEGVNGTAFILGTWTTPAASHCFSALQ